MKQSIAFPVLLLLLLGVTSSATMRFAPLQREQILNVRIDPTHVLRSIKGVRIRFAPGQPTGRHLHPVPTVGVVTEGTFVFQAQGEQSKLLGKGDAFYEPAGVPILMFNNRSATSPAEIEAFYLQEDPSSPIVKMLSAP